MTTTPLDFKKYSEIIDETERLEEGRFYNLELKENEKTIYFFGSRNRDEVRKIITENSKNENIMFRIITTNYFLRRLR